MFLEKAVFHWYQYGFLKLLPIIFVTKLLSDFEKEEGGSFCYPKGNRLIIKAFFAVKSEFFYKFSQKRAFVPFIMPSFATYWFSASACSDL